MTNCIFGTDACNPNPCYRGVRCLNSPDSLHTHTCGPCPIGLTGNGFHCELVNEVSLSNICIQFELCSYLHFIFSVS